MRVAVSGSHSTGKSALIAAFLERRPGFEHEVEAYEELADEVPLSSSGGPTLEGLEALLLHTVETVVRYGAGARVVFERSPVDYLAYAAAGEPDREQSEVKAFLEAHRPLVETALHHLDLIALLPVSAAGPVTARAGEDDGLRRRADEMLRRALVDDAYDLLGNETAPDVAVLPIVPDQQLAALLRLTGAGRGR